MIQILRVLPPGAVAKFVGPDDPHEKSDGPTDGMGSYDSDDKGYYCTTCYRAWPCQYESAKQYKARVYAKMVRAIASGASPERVAEAVIHAVQTDNIGWHHDGGDPEGMNLRYKPMLVRGI